MGLAQIEVSVTLTQINCGCCGGTYAINERYRQEQYEKGKSWHCPYCETGWGYSGGGENGKLKRELEAERQRKTAALQRANDAERAARNAKAATTRLKHRGWAGVCPCCHRTFSQLAAHMKAKHPEAVK